VNWKDLGSAAELSPSTMTEIRNLDRRIGIPEAHAFAEAPSRGHGEKAISYVDSRHCAAVSRNAQAHRSLALPVRQPEVPDGEHP